MADTSWTGKQKRFCEEYIIDLNATKAAIRAGYSPNTAYSIGNELLNKPDIKNEVDRLKTERAERTAITAEKVLTELAKIAFADITHISEWDEKTGKVKIKSSNELDNLQTAAIQEVSDRVNLYGRSIKVKMHDKKGALELLGRHLALFTDKTELTGADNGAVEIKFNMKEPPAKSEQTKDS